MPDEININGNGEPVASPRTFKEYFFYKLDRNVAILGIIGVAMYSMYMLPPEASMQVVSGGMGGLIVYIGARGVK